jgi:hypothetical protein
MVMGSVSVLLLVSVLGLPALDLGELETAAVDEALEERSLTLAPNAEGKVIGKVHIVTLEVFSHRDPLARHLTWANRFHRITRDYIIQREALFRDGDRYRQAIVDETARKLRNRIHSTIVAIVPILAANLAETDVLIVTRDVWSLRLNQNWEYQGDRFVFLSLSISENNLLGLRKSLALAFVMDQGEMSAGPTYTDPNIAGTRLTFSASALAHFNRDTGASEGSTASASLSYPLYSLARKWGVSTIATHSDTVFRRFLGNELRQADFADTPEVESWPWIYRVNRLIAGTEVVRSFPGDVIQRVSMGHYFSTTRPSFTADFPEDAQARMGFAQRFFPRSQRISALFAVYQLFTPRYRAMRNLNTFDLQEDVQLGPAVSLMLSRSTPVLGSERNTYRGKLRTPEIGVAGCRRLRPGPRWCGTWMWAASLTSLWAVASTPRPRLSRMHCGSWAASTPRCSWMTPTISS